jgi:hypothetical protein
VRHDRQASSSLRLPSRVSRSSRFTWLALHLIRWATFASRSVELETTTLYVQILLLQGIFASCRAADRVVHVIRRSDGIARNRLGSSRQRKMRKNLRTADAEGYIAPVRSIDSQGTSAGKTKVPRKVHTLNLWSSATLVNALQ